MKGKNPVFGALTAMLVTGLIAGTSKGSVKINEPSEAANVPANAKVMLMYEVELGQDGDHLHVTLNDKQASIIRDPTGHAEVGPLKAGKHKLCLLINTKSHKPTGAEACINITAN